MLGVIVIILITFFYSKSQSSINLQKIDIVRDSFGVPHIFAPTDEQVVYGLAWATCEDDFKTLQWSLLAAKGLLGRYMGIEGVKIDYAVHLMNVRNFVEHEYEKQVTAQMHKLYSAYVTAVNSYAKLHPEEILIKEAFPTSAKDLVCGYMLSMALLGGIKGDIEKIVSKADNHKGKPEPIEDMKGSNAFAFNSSKTSDGSVMININSHQPLEGPLSWYEIHLASDEGWNITGGTFHGGICVFHGANENLAWAHTVNHDIDLIDVYQLEMHPSKKNYYKFEDKWLKLKTYTAKLKVALGKNKKFVIPVQKKYWESVYGPTYKKGKVAYSLRMDALMNLRPAEQWYKMNKARNFTEFKRALDVRGISMMNIIYGDRFDTIYKVSNATIPIRNPQYNWKNILPGNTSKTLWTKIYPMDSLVYYINPKCGYVFNCNNSSFEGTSKSENRMESEFPESMGHTMRQTSRGRRFYELMDSIYTGKISYEDFKKIKYDQYFPDSIIFLKDYNINDLFDLPEEKYNNLRSEIQTIKSWDKRFNGESTNATLVLKTMYNIYYGNADENKLAIDKDYRMEYFAKCLEKAKDTLNHYFGSYKIPLTKFQVHQRGNIELGVSGGPDVLNAAYADKYKDGKMKIWVGDSFLQLVKYKNGKVEIESVNAYGASNKENSPHYTDQMKMYVNKELKYRTLQKEYWYSHAEKIYHPQ